MAENPIQQEQIAIATKSATSQKFYSTEEVGCIPCDSIVSLSETSSRYGFVIADALHTPMMELFMMMATLWVIYAGCKVMVGKMSPTQAMLEALVIIGTYVSLDTFGSEIARMVYKTVMDAAVGAVAMIFIALGESGLIKDLPPTSDLSGINGAILVVFKGMTSVLDIIIDIFESGGIFSPGPFIMGMFLLAAFIPPFLLFVSKFAVLLFRVMLISIFTPVAGVSFAFPQTRKIAVIWFKLCISAIVVLFTAALAIGLMIFIVSQMDLQKDALSMKNPAFWLVLAVGAFGTALQTEAVGIANTLFGTSLSNTPATVLAGLIGAGAIMGYNKLVKPTAGLGGSAVSAGVQQIRNRVASVAQANHGIGA